MAQPAAFELGSLRFNFYTLQTFIPLVCQPGELGRYPAHITMDITLADVKRWATTSELDQKFEQLSDDDQDFDLRILSLCDPSALLELASNRHAPKRQFFAFDLVQRLVHVLYSPHGLPYEFSRFSGMITFEKYQMNELQRIANIYDQCSIVEKMRNSSQEEIQNIGNMILDFRHDRRFPNASTGKLLQLLNYQIQQSFRPNTTTYTMRICQTCEDGFKSWLVSGNEVEIETCPFCKLNIQYPQKTGKNAG